jgi:hypothetical protein
MEEQGPFWGINIRQEARPDPVFPGPASPLIPIKQLEMQGVGKVLEIRLYV